jgi:hypothetical protein
MEEELTLELIRKLRESQDRHEKFVYRMYEEGCRINESKESLRIALVNKGFDIPEGLKLSEWIPYIEKGVRL